VLHDRRLVKQVSKVIWQESPFAAWLSALRAGTVAHGGRNAVMRYNTMRRHKSKVPIFPSVSGPRNLIHGSLDHISQPPNAISVCSAISIQLTRVPNNT